MPARGLRVSRYPPQPGSVLGAATTLSPSFLLAQAIFEPNFSRINAPTFSNLVILHTYPPMKMEQIECSETAAYKIQMPGNYAEESVQQPRIISPNSMNRLVLLMQSQCVYYEVGIDVCV